MQWNSPDYWAGIHLRNQLLKKDFGKALIATAALEERTDIHVVVRREREVIGTLLLHPINQALVQIKQVVIKDSYQGKGIGKQLLDYAEKLALKMGYVVVFLTGRKQAWHFYEILAYKEIGKSYIDGQLELKIFKKELTSFQLETAKDQKEMKTNG